MLSRDSNVINLQFTGQSSTFQRPYYMKSELAANEQEWEQRYQELEEYSESLEERIRALEERMEPDPEEGEENG